MGQGLDRAAKEVGCSQTTLRRYVGDGLLRGRRIVPRQLEISSEEESYLKSHWALLRELKAALRTERDVRLAVLFGSTAIGEDLPESDVDLLISHRCSDQRRQAGLRLRLRRALGKPVHLVSLEQADASPSLFADVLREGRPLIDRDGLWGTLQERVDEVLAQAAREERSTALRARDAVAAARARIR
jgi:predicted nucleotidyltransferase